MSFGHAEAACDHGPIQIGGVMLVEKSTDRHPAAF